MQKEIRTVNEEKKILQITTIGERWYARPGEDPKTKLPIFTYVPSSSWIAGHYPKGIGYYKWLADKGWDESEAIKSAAGARGSKVHQATELIEMQGSLSIDSMLINPDTHKEEPIALDEYEAVASFTRWFNTVKPIRLATEFVVFGKNYAGTLDRIYRIDGQIWIVDFKTSQYVWEEYILQVSSYSHADIDYKALGITDEEWAKRKLAILQIGYQKNKLGYKWNEIPDKYDLFVMARAIWNNENPEAKPKQRDIPMRISLEEIV